MSQGLYLILNVVTNDPIKPHKNIQPKDGSLSITSACTEDAKTKSIEKIARNLTFNLHL